MKTVQILLPILNLFPLTYSVEDDLILNVGDLVQASFRNKEVLGIVWDLSSDIDFVGKKIKLKQVSKKIDFIPPLDISMIRLIEKVAHYYFTELGSVAKLSIPIDLDKPPAKKLSQDITRPYSLPTLSSEQEETLNLIKESSRPVILKGVTGSGKTEVYFHLCAEYLKMGKQVLIMLPEIALSQQIIKRFIDRFGFEPIIWNSSVTKAKKKQIFAAIANGDVSVVIGTRSSLFLPYKNLGLIVVDEEHDASYKQEDNILYNARDMAVLRGYVCNAKILLCSATPSIESIYNARQGKYQLLTLASRYKNASMPAVELVDMKGASLAQNQWISKPLIEAIKQNLERGEQTLLFLNRRGYAPLILCRTCGFRFVCKSCSAWLVMHKHNNKMECHHCGHQERIHKICPECKEDKSLTACGPGVERIEDEVKALFPTSKVALISKDQFDKQENINKLLDKLENNEIDILVGTQVITKGYHFPHLTLVGVIDADIGFVGGDLRASERTFQLLHQVAGRAGRESKPGRVIIQSYYPENLVFSTLINNSESDFIEYELQTRESHAMPPFTKMASMVLSGKDELRTLNFAKQLLRFAPSSEIKILGPAKSLMFKISNKYRYRILIIADKKLDLQKYLNVWLERVKIPSYCHIKVDIDPQSFF